MEQYISKSAVVAEIEKRMLRYEQERKTEPAYYDGLYTALEDLRDDFINTIEVKEVDLEKELVDYHNENFNPCDDGTLLSVETGSELAWYDYERIAKHFFELGLRYKSSYVSIPNIDDTLKEMGVDPYSKIAKIFKESYCMALEKLKEKKGE